MNSASATKTASSGKTKPASKPFITIGPGAPKLLTKKQQLQLFRGIGAMLKAQINTGDAIKFYANGLPDKVLAKDLGKVNRDITAGISIHEAFRKSGRFNDMTIGLIQAGSDSGKLDEAFNSLARRIKVDLMFSAAIKKATIMPAVVISILVLAFVASQVIVAPKIEDMIRDTGQNADGFLGLVFATSHLVQDTWFIVVPILIATVLIIAFVAPVRNFLATLLMSRWRVFRTLVMSLRQSTFLGTMELLYSNGINLARSIRVSANSVKKTPFYGELLNTADKYEHTGVPVATAFGKYTSCDDQVVHMLGIGEKTASLELQLRLLTEMLEEEAQTYMGIFTTMLNVIVLILAVILIGTVFAATFLPIFLLGPKLINSGF